MACHYLGLLLPRRCSILDIMNYKKHILSNGLRVITVPMPQAESVTLTVWCRVGSRFETEKVAGLSHFLEHMVFKGSSRRPTAKDISTAVDSIGGEFNAATSKEWTNFYIRAGKNNLERAFDVLSDMVLNPLIKEEEVQREKGVILEEKAMYEDTPLMDIDNVFETLIFEGNTLGRDTIGTEKAIKDLMRRDFVSYRSKYYFGRNLLVTVSGGVSEKRVVELAQKYFSNLNRGAKGKADEKKFRHKQTRPGLKLKSKKVDQAHLVIGFRGNPLGHKDRFVEAVMASILGQGMSSRLFIEVRERRGLCYSIHSSVEHYTDAGYISTYAGVDPKKADEAIEVILDEHYKIKSDHGISGEELKKAKEYLKGHLALALENTSVVNSLFGEQELLLGEALTPEEMYEGIDKVKIEDVVGVAKKLFKKEGLNLAMIGPYNTEERFERIIK